MSVRTRLIVAVAALVLLVGGVVLGRLPKQIHIAACGSPVAPAETTNQTHEAVSECGFALDKRYAVMWWLFVGGGALGLAAVLGGVLTSGSPSSARASSSVQRHGQR